MTSKLIVALDFDNKNQALNLVEQLDPTLCALKIGNELFTSFGPVFVTQLINKGYRIFLDLKFHDIPNTVSKACKAAADLGVWMLNVHASGGLEMMQAAVNALNPYGNNRPLLIAVTVLTSFKQEEMLSIGITKPILEQASDLAQLTKTAGLAGVVCSAYEVKAIKELCGPHFITVTPGIRLPSGQSDDQSRIMTPQQAVATGSDYLVVGRPITQAANPLYIVQEIIRNINQ